MMDANPMWTDALGAWSALASAIVGALALVAIVIVGTQIRLQRTQLHRDLENMYVARYWSIMDRIADSELLPTGEAERQRNLAIRSYLRLSEDECDLRAADRVTNDTWRFWLDGIRGQLDDPEFRDALESAPHDQFLNLRRLVSEPDGFEPSITAARVRQRRGL